MRKLAELREQRAQRVAEMQALVAKAESENNRDFSDNEKQRFDSLKTEVRGLDEQISRHETVAELERRAEAATTVHGDVSFEQLERRVSVLAALRHLTDPTRFPLQGAELEYHREAERRNGKPSTGILVPFAVTQQVEQRAPMLTTVAPEIVPVDHRPDLYVDAFRRALISSRLGVRVLTGLTGDLSIPRRDSGTSVGWVGEHQPLPETGMTFDSVSLTPRHVGAIVELSRQLIMQSSPDIEALVRQDLAASVAEAVDTALIDGGAAPEEPVGILRTSGVLEANLNDVSATNRVSWATVVNMIGMLEDGNVPGPYQWLMSPKAARALRVSPKNPDATEYIFQNGQVGEIPALSSGFVPDADATHGTAILGNWSMAMLGIWGALELTSNPYAEDVFRRGGVLVRAISSLDIGFRDPSAFVVADDILVA